MKQKAYYYLTCFCVGMILERCLYDVLEANSVITTDGVSFVQKWNATSYHSLCTTIYYAVYTVYTEINRLNTSEMKVKTQLLTVENWLESCMEKSIKIQVVRSLPK